MKVHSVEEHSLKHKIHATKSTALIHLNCTVPNNIILAFNFIICTPLNNDNLLRGCQNRFNTPNNSMYFKIVQSHKQRHAQSQFVLSKLKFYIWELN